MDVWKWRVLPLLSLLVSFLLLYIRSGSRPSPSIHCSLLPHDQYLLRSKRIVTPDGVIAGAVQVKRGVIVSVVRENQLIEYPREHLVDYGEAVVMPGLVDVHVHLDEPGRVEWEGFSTGTKAAAAGGITTLIDMPLNSFPSTVSKEALQLKVEAARDKIYVDVGFWGGLVPDNAFNRSALESLLNAGVLGFKSFMCPSGINDFPMTNATHIKEGLHVLAQYNRPLLVHAEIQLDSEGYVANAAYSDARSYSTYLRTRPPSWEQAAVRELQGVVQDTKVGGRAAGAHLHIVHLSDASLSLDIIKGVVKSRLPWNLLYAIFISLPEFQKARLAEMRLRALLSIVPFWVDLALLMGLKDRWDRGCNAFLSPWGHMTPTLEDVARLIGLRVHGDPVTGTTQSDYRDLARRALGYEDRGLGPLRTIRGSAFTDMLGVRGLKKEADESLEEYVARVGHALAGRWAQEEGRQARRDLRVLLFFFLGRVLFATKGSLVSLRFLTVIVDLREVGSYAWGAAMLAHLFYHLSRVTRETGIAGFSPFLQVWAYTYLPLTSPRLPRALHPTGDAARGIPYMARWTPIVDRHSMFQQLETVKRGLADIREGEITWMPYEGDGTEGQPWIVEGQHMFGRDIFLHALSFVEPLYIRLVTRTLGHPQAVVDTAVLIERPRRSQRYVGAYETD